MDSETARRVLVTRIHEWALPSGLEWLDIPYDHEALDIEVPYPQPEAGLDHGWPALVLAVASDNPPSYTLACLWRVMGPVVEVDYYTLLESEAGKELFIKAVNAHWGELWKCASERYKKYG